MRPPDMFTRQYRQATPSLLPTELPLIIDKYWGFFITLIVSFFATSNVTL